MTECKPCFLLNFPPYSKSVSHDEEVRKLYEEMEQQIRAEKERILAEVRSFRKYFYVIILPRVDKLWNQLNISIYYMNHLIGYCWLSCLLCIKWLIQKLQIRNQKWHGCRKCKQGYHRCDFQYFVSFVHGSDQRTKINVEFQTFTYWLICIIEKRRM